MKIASQTLDTTQAAEYIGVAKATLETWRVRGGGPLFLRLGARGRGPVRYRKTDLDAWLDSRVCKHT